MTLHPRAAGTTIILERIGSDPSGNNDRPRETVCRMTIPEADTLLLRLGRALDMARAAAASEQQKRRTQALANLEVAKRHVAEIEAQILRLDQGDLGGVEPDRTEAKAPAAEPAVVVTTAHGVPLPIQPRNEPEECSRCSGTGRHQGAFGGPDWPLCGACEGTGTIPPTRLTLAEAMATPRGGDVPPEPRWTAAAPMVPTPTQAVAARALVELEPEMPDFLRRTA